MANKRYYSDFSKYCMKQFCKAEDVPYEDIKRQNYIACAKALRGLPKDVADMMVELYSAKGNFTEKLREISKTYSVSIEHLWKWISILERSIARERGLI